MGKRRGMKEGELGLETPVNRVSATSGIEGKPNLSGYELLVHGSWGVSDSTPVAGLPLHHLVSHSQRAKTQ